MDTVIKNGTVVTSEGKFEGDVAINGEKIVAIGQRGAFPSAKKVIDAEGKYVLPGAIDIHTHIEEPFQGTTPEEDWEMGTKNAAMGGVTTVLNFSMQEKGAPLMDVIHQHKKRAGELACIDFNFHGVFKDYSNIKAVEAEIEDLFAEGITSVKAFMIYTGEDLYTDDWGIYSIMRKLKELGGFLGVHAENMFIGERLQEEFIEQGKTDSTYWPKTKPNFVEAEAVQRACLLAEATESNLYIVHTSAKESLDIISSYRAKGLPIFSETCPHYMIFNEDIYSKPGVGVWQIISPPLRKPADQEALWNGIDNGVVSLVGSDHNAYGKVFKDKDYEEEGFIGVANGGPGILEGLSVVYSEGVAKGRLTMERMVEVTSTNNAKMFGLYPQKGTIAPGSDADIVIFDPEKIQRLGEDLYEGMDWTVYEDMLVTGFPSMTMLRGQIIMEDGEFKGQKGAGRFIPGKMDKNVVRTIR